MDYKDKLLLKVLKYIDVKLGNVQGNVVVLNDNDPYFTNEDRQFLFNSLCRLDDEFGAIQIPETGHEDSYKIVANQKEITSLIKWLTKKEREDNINEEMTVTTNKRIYEYKNLIINLETDILNYDGIKIPISPENRPIKYLCILIENQGKVVPHKEIARIFQFNEYDPSTVLKDIDFKRDVSWIKRDITKAFAALGKEKSKEIRAMVKMVKNTGSTLR